jgi:CheY-like chemotaxis protein
MGGRVIIIITKLSRAVNFLSLLHPLIIRTEGELIINSNNDNGNNSNSNIHNTSSYKQFHNTTTTTSTISSRKEQEEEGEELLLPPYAKLILIIDDDPDITLTFKKGLESENNNKNNMTFFKVYAYNNPLEALSQFKPNFYDLLLIDINMPKMNGFELSTKILELDINPRICFMSSGQINQEALREQYPTLSIGCFITKPVTIEYLFKRIKAELD